MKGVEWLVEQLEGDDSNIARVIGLKKYNSIIKQAKEMEKQQLQECWDISHQAGRYEGKGIAEENWQTFEDYWNEINL
jgi:GTP-dependent phosphoenolpyruvate carboxykinase